MLYILFFERTTFNVGFLLGIKAFTAAVLGGIGNLRGALLGGLLLGLIENYGAGHLRHPVDATSIAFVVLVLVLMFRPTGLLGESLGRARADEHRQPAPPRARPPARRLGQWPRPEVARRAPTSCRHARPRRVVLAVPLPAPDAAGRR